MDDQPGTLALSSPAAAEHYNYFRDYDPSIGRYVGSDPEGLDGGTADTYSYVGGRPLSYIDPQGDVIRLITLCGKGYKVVRTVGWKEAVRMARDGKFQLKGDSRSEMKRLAKAASKGEKPIDHGAGHEPYNNPHLHPGPHPGKGGHLFYEVASGLTVAHYFAGCDCALENAAYIIDFFNPLAAGKDVLDILGYGDDDE